MASGSRQKDAQILELTGATAGLKADLEASKASHEEYKTKAKKVLQEKENLIGTLRAEPGAAAGLEAGPEGGSFEEAELQQAL